MLSAILDGIFVLIYLTILLSRDTIFGLLVFGLGVVQVVLLLGTSRRVHELNQQELAAKAESQGYMVEALTGVTTLKASGAEHRAFDHWSNLFFAELNVSLQSNQLSAFIDTVMTTLRTFSPLILLWVGALHVLDGTMSLGTMLALNGLAVAFLTPLSSLVMNGQGLQLVGAHLDRVADVLRRSRAGHSKCSECFTTLWSD